MSTLLSLPLPTPITMNSSIVLAACPGEKPNCILSSPFYHCMHSQSSQLWPCLPGTSPLYPLFSISLATGSPLPVLPLTDFVTATCNWSPGYCHSDLSETWRTPSSLLKAFLCLPLSLGTKPITPTTKKVLQFRALISTNLCLSFLQVLVFKQCQTLKISSYA